ncbi:PAS domain-containing sensor histidine kinase [Polaromonas sp.]|nr:PAS domain-containing sensor histidine kinase [Candidatus Saccharibacteria bacterium]
MASSVPAQVIESSVTQSGRRVGLVLPTVAFLICVSVQYAFTDFFDQINGSHLLLVLLGLTILMLADELHKKPSVLWRRTHWVLMHITALYGIGFLLPLPSPYLLFVALLATLTYVSLGKRALLISIFGSLGLLSGRYLAIYGLEDRNRAGMFFATYFITLVLTYYSVVYLLIAEKELAALSTDSARAVSQQKQMESLINNISDGVIAVDKHHKVSVYNAAALDVLDLNTDIKGQGLASLLRPINDKNEPVNILLLLNETTVPTINRDLRVKYKDGSEANLFMGIAPVYLGFGKSENNGYTLLLRDITREKSLEEERDEFISVVSHELRTPIAISEGNIGNAEYIAEKTGDMVAVKAALKEAHNQVLFLASMINDLSTLSRAERGVLQVEPEPIIVTELAQELLSNYTPDATKKGLALSLEIDPGVGTLSSGKLYVREVLQNFITNAIKYTETGSVTIGAKPGDNGTTFYVRDTGIGISKGDQDRVFDKFFRSEDYRTRQSNGTGLGLYVTMKLTRLLKAQISVESELNKGSTFTIFFPNLTK